MIAIALIAVVLVAPQVPVEPGQVTLVMEYDLIPVEVTVGSRNGQCSVTTVLDLSSFQAAGLDFTAEIRTRSVRAMESSQFLSTVALARKVGDERGPSQDSSRDPGPSLRVHVAGITWRRILDEGTKAQRSLIRQMKSLADTRLAERARRTIIDRTMSEAARSRPR